MEVKPGLVYDCPHCPAQNQGFDYVIGYVHPVKGWPGKHDHGHRDFLTFKCGNCHAPVVVEIYRSVAEYSGTKPLQLMLGYKEGNYRVVSIKPARQTVGSAPEHTPDRVAACYAQACRALDRGDADTAGMGFRKALDVATRQLIRDLTPENMEEVLARKLYSRIEWLHAQGNLTADLKTWAHSIRDEGNDAAHEEDPYTPEEAQDLHDLTEVFLMYVFTIPGKIAERHPEIAEPPEGNEAPS